MATTDGYLRFDAMVDGRDGDPDNDGECKCVEFDGKVLPADDPFWSANTPPLHRGCRCVLTPTNAAGEVIRSETSVWMDHIQGRK